MSEIRNRISTVPKINGISNFLALSNTYCLIVRFCSANLVEMPAMKNMSGIKYGLKNTTMLLIILLLSK